jgi:uncharacterized damage-inducible protein DinB
MPLRFLYATTGRVFRGPEQNPPGIGSPKPRDPVRCCKMREGGRTMDAQTARTLFAYNRWANRRLLKAASRLPAKDLDRDLRGSFRSLQGTFRHLVWGERSWLRMWREVSFGPDLSPKELPDLRSIARAWTALEKAQAAYFEALDDERLRAPFSVGRNRYALGELIQHAINHSTHHRGQIVLMLRQLGGKPPGTGFRQFLTASRRTRA